METLIDPFELHAPGSEPAAPRQRVRPKMQSIVIEMDWGDPPPSLHGVREWATED